MLPWNSYVTLEHNHVSSILRVNKGLCLCYNVILIILFSFCMNSLQLRSFLEMIMRKLSLHLIKTMSYYDSRSRHRRFTIEAEYCTPTHINVTFAITNFYENI